MNISASSSGNPFFEIREEDQNQMPMMMKQQQQQHSSSTPTSSSAPPPPAQKKKRNQPGTPSKYPDAEVIALSPKTLMATNRFICEVCNKGFQREQNLQLHRRGHNLPWKLKQKTTKEVKRKVYLCPEPTCVHHDPSRALGDLTGIKKHYSRKHGEKKWKCEKCSKRYAVQSDWKAHSKTCGTREYRCDCGTLFSRRDSFITHRAFCDALAQESARHPPSLSAIGSHLYASNNSNMGVGLSQVGHQLSSIKDQTNQSGDVLRLGSSAGGNSRSTSFDHLLPPSIGSSSASSFRPPPHTLASSSPFFMQESNPHQNYHDEQQQNLMACKSSPFQGLMQFADIQSSTSNDNPVTSAANLFNLSFLPNSSSSTSNIRNNVNNTNTGNFHHHFNSDHQNGVADHHHQGSSNISNTNIFTNSLLSASAADQLSSGAVPSLFSSSVVQNETMQLPHMSATALLQKAAQMGSSSSSGSKNNNSCNNNTTSLLRSFGGNSSSRPNHHHHHFGGAGGGIFSGGPGGSSENDATTNNSSIHELMNSNNTNPFANSSIFATGSNEVNPASAFGQPYSSNEAAAKLHQQNLNASDRLTRDFLGVGQIVRSMSGGFSQREKQQQQQQHGGGSGLDISSLDSDQRNLTAATPSNQSFGAGGEGSF